MNSQNLYQAYYQICGPAANRHEFILQRTAAAAGYCRAARSAISAGDHSRQTSALQGALASIQDLRQTLLFQQRHPVVRKIANLYAFLDDQLALAKMYRDIEIVDSVLTVLSDMLAAWSLAFQQTSPGESEFMLELESYESGDYWKEVA